MGTSMLVAPPTFTLVAPALFLGNARAAGATELLQRSGITLCVNVSRLQPGPSAPGVAELRVPVFDDPHEDLLVHLEPTCAAMEAAVRAGGACLVYCKNGRSRSAAVCTAYLMRYRGLSLERAFQVGASGAGPAFEGGWASCSRHRCTRLCRAFGKRHPTTPEDLPEKPRDPSQAL
uniref:Dual specificity phosphatase 28 n=1 Tax=Marmota marmota marmota TaxID=9994 RepID=A0A8C5YYD0_MARMA